MKSDLIIFGRSPFINQVDVDALLPHYTTIGFNRFAERYAVDYLFVYDHYYPPAFESVNVVAPNWIKAPCTKIMPKATGRPIYPKRFQDKMLCVGFKYFTVSLAVNWAILKGFKNIYLVGIDHNENESQLQRFDGDATPTSIRPEAHQRVKRFIEACAGISGAKIYQCNPDATGWELPFQDIGALYAAGIDPKIR